MTPRAVPWDAEAEALQRALDRRDLLAPGDLLGGRRVLGLVGRGGSAQVYRVLRGEGRGAHPEALKVLEPRPGGRGAPGGPDGALDGAAGTTGAARARFHRECEVAAEVRHPGVVAVLGHGEGRPVRRRGGTPSGEPLLWAALELFDGGTAASLRPSARRHGVHRPGHREVPPPQLPRVLDVLAQVAAGLDAVHDHGVVHGDVKPTNLLLAGRRAPDPGRAAVADFGLARWLDETRPLARHGRAAGSLPYAAPEVLQAQRVTAATDVYSLGCTAVELLTGEPPFPLPTTFAVVRAHLADRPPLLSRRRAWLPAAVDPVVAGALARDPALRPASCRELVEGLERALAPLSPRR